MNSRRALLAVLIAGGQSLSASAGCFDWLFGCKTTPQPAPFAVGAMPPTTITPLGPPVPVGQPFITPSQTSTGFVQPTGGTFAQFPVAGTQSHAMAFSGNFVGPTVVNNPSVLSGMQVNPNAPQVSAFRGMAQPMQTAPVTNTWWGATAPQTSYNAAAAFNAPAAAPVTSGTWSHPMQVSPTQPPETSNGWLGMKQGNSYQTTYNNVPTTVYRPVQQVDPATGQMVIVQQPCQTTTQQVQRTPTSTLQHVPATPPASPYGAEPGCGNENPGYPGGVTYPAQPNPQAAYPGSTGAYNPNGYGSGVTQATSVEPPVSGYGNNGYGNSQIPSTAPQPLSGNYSDSGSTGNGYYGQGSTTSPAAPSYPSTPASPSSPNGSGGYGSGGYGDASAVEQPRLQAPPLGSSGSSTSGGSSSSNYPSGNGSSGSYQSGSDSSGTGSSSGYPSGGSSSSNYPSDSSSSSNYSSGGSSSSNYSSGSGSSDSYKSGSGSSSGSSSSNYPSGGSSSSDYSSGNSSSSDYGSKSGSSTSGGSGTGSYDSSSYSSGSNDGSGNASTPSNPVSAKYSDLPPIPAADNYEPPAWNSSNPNGNRPQSGSPTQPGQPGSATPRISPPSWADRTAMRVNEPLREPGYDAARRGEATSNRAATPSAWQRASFPPATPPAAAQPPKRDTGGWVPANPSGR